ncbi:MAG: tRNA(Glu)-specific nuclease WapA precursor [Planctomycetes bacterium ADurb.Bin126]|nr:MAG: tRNA(Glu)-specific nuclease WapA precursor [Planctomycetes bacterium ADurb.Bin126]
MPTHSGWDRFGRVVQQTWTVDGSAVDSYAYGYDLNSNRLYRENLQTSNFDELYEYDDLNRLIDMGRGNLDQSKLFLSNTGYSQTWTLDQLGNWTGLQQDDDGDGQDQAWSQTRTHNAVNEITDITDSRGWIDPTYDEAGNMISGPTPGDEDARQHYTYDAWNRMTGVYDDDAQDPGNPGTQIMTYTYDGLNRLAVSHDNFYYHFYYNEQWQTLEVRRNNPADGDPERQYVWDIRYIDAPVVRFFDGNLDGDYADEDDNVLYYCNDANMNVTALVDASDGSVVERYAYTAYGQPIVLNPDTWAERQNGSVYKNWRLFAGYRFDDETGLYLVRNRVYQAELGRWAQRDPVRAGLNSYEYATSNALRATDPLGLDPTIELAPWYDRSKDPTKAEFWDALYMNNVETISNEQQYGWIGPFNLPGMRIPHGSLNLYTRTMFEAIALDQLVDTPQWLTIPDHLIVALNVAWTRTVSTAHEHSGALSYDTKTREIFVWGPFEGTRGGTRQYHKIVARGEAFGFYHTHVPSETIIGFFSGGDVISFLHNRYVRIMFARSCDDLWALVKTHRFPLAMPNRNTIIDVTTQNPVDMEFWQVHDKTKPIPGMYPFGSLEDKQAWADYERRAVEALAHDAADWNFGLYRISDLGGGYLSGGSMLRKVLSK